MDSKKEEVQNSTKLYLREIGQYPVLSTFEEQELAKRMSMGDLQAKEKFIKSNLRLVVSIAKRFKTEKFELLDLIQEGNLGLLRAVDMYDYTKGYKFSTYAEWWIKQSIWRAFENKGEIIKVPVHMKAMINKYNRQQDAFYKKYSRYASTEEIAKEMQLPTEKVQEIEKYYSIQTISLNTTISFEEGTELGDFIKDEKETPEEILMNEANKEIVNKLIAKANLTERQENVIRMHFILEKSLDAIARELGVTKEKVRQIENKSFIKLRRAARDLGNFI